MQADGAKPAKKRKSLSVSKAKKDAGQGAAVPGAGAISVAPPLERESIFLPSHLSPTAGAGTAPSTEMPESSPALSGEKRRKLPVDRLGQDKVDYELELALKLSAQDANRMSRVVNLPVSDETHQSAERSNEAACDGSSEISGPRSPSAGDYLGKVGVGDNSDKSTLPPALSAPGTDKSSATPALQTASAVSARDTKKKQKRFSDEGDSAHAPMQASPTSAVKVKQAPSRAAKRRTIDDSDEDEQEVAKSRGFPRDALTKREDGDAESDSIPDSEGEGNEHAIQGPGLEEKGQKQQDDKAASRKRLVRSDSSEDEDPAHQAEGSNETHRQAASTALQSAKGKPRKKVTADKEEMPSSDDAEEGEFESSAESEESDEDFESEDDDDFKGKKSKGGKQKVVTSKAAVKSTTSRAAAQKALCRTRQVPQAVERAPAATKKSRASRELASLAYSNPGIKAAVPSLPAVNHPQAIAPVPSLPAIVKVHSSSSATVQQKVVAAEEAKATTGSTKIITQPNPPDCPKVVPPLSKNAPPQNSDVSASSLRLHAHGAASASGPSRTVASMPPRVGLAKSMKAHASLHRAAFRSAPATGAAGATEGARSGGLSGGVKIVGGAQGVRRPGLHRNGFIKQQLHARPDD